MRLTYNVNLVKTKDFTYVKMQTNMWAFAEISFGLAASCMPIVPRLYQQISSVTPYTKDTPRNTWPNPTSKASVSNTAHQAAHWGSQQRDKGGDWIHLDDRNFPGLPARTDVEVQQRTADEDAVAEAVEGTNGKSRNDLETGKR